MKAAFLTVVVLMVGLLLAMDVSAEVLFLKDGTKLEGAVTRTADGYEVKDTSGKVSQVSIDDVQSIQIGSPKALGAAEAQSRLVSLRHSVDNVSDLNAIIQDYRHFIEQYKDSPIAAEAQRDLTTWQQRRDQQLVKLGARWVTVQERDQVRQQATASLPLARDLMNMGKPKDAETIIMQAMAVDPGNPTASFLEGLLLFDRQDMPAARKNFETVVAELNNHAPTLNNLSVVLWRQNQTVAAINSYVQAMLAQPGSRTILDNVAEVLHLVPANIRQNPAVIRATQIFSQQDAELQKQMAVNGLHRWGATWIDAAKFDAFQAAQTQADEAIAKLNAQADDLKQQINHIDTEIRNDQQNISTLQTSSVFTDTRGRTIYINHSSQISALQQSIASLQRDRADDQTKWNSLQMDMQKEQAKVGTPKYTGQQKIFGIPETPGLAPMKNAPVDADSPIAPAGTQPIAPALSVGIKG